MENENERTEKGRLQTIKKVNKKVKGGVDDKMLHIDPWQSRMFQLCKQSVLHDSAV